MKQKYDYAVEKCDIPSARYGLLREYRNFRDDITERINGDDATSIKNQILDLTWNTAVFRMLNEARFLEKERAVSSTMWELIVAGYASMMILGIRRLLDTNRRSNSLISTILKIKDYPHFHTRELYVCHDGLPFDWLSLQTNAMKTMRPGLQWLPTKGPTAYAGSELAHLSFNKFCSEPATGKRGEKFSIDLLDELTSQLNTPGLRAIHILADQRYAHMDRHSAKTDSIPNVTYNDIDSALENLVRIGNRLSLLFLNQHVFGSAVATPQFNPVEHLDQAWITPSTAPLMEKYWDEISTKMNLWAYD